MAARHKYRIPCETINKQNKLPCKASGIYCKTTKTARCRIHGGLSTGPKTEEGKRIALMNLKQFNDKRTPNNSEYFQRDTASVNEREASHNYLPRQSITKSKPSL